MGIRETRNSFIIDVDGARVSISKSNIETGGKMAIASALIANGVSPSVAYLIADQIVSRTV